MDWTEDEARDAYVERRRERYDEMVAELDDRDPFDGLPGLDQPALPGLGR